jgi:hypothetical protein
MIEWYTASVLAFGIAFWATVFLLVLLASISTEYERFSGTTVVLVVGIALAWWLTKVNPFYWALEHWYAVLGYIAIYLGVGVGYGIFKWKLFVTKIVDKLRDFRRDKKIEGPLSAEQFTSFKSFASYYGELPVRVTRHKRQITGWMIYWPFSLPWTLINEPIKRFFNFVYYRLAGRLQDMSDNAFKDLT